MTREILWRLYNETLGVCREYISVGDCVLEKGSRVLRIQQGQTVQHDVGSDEHDENETYVV